MSKDLSKIKQTEAVELSKWKKILKKGEYVGYPIVIIALISLIRALDEFVTSAPSSLQTSIVTDFFVKGQGLDFATGLSQMSLIGSALLVFGILAVLFLTLADKYGRKPILTISVIGMGVGVLLCFLSPNLPIHIIGRALLMFFIGTDIHRIYTLEIAKRDKRSLVSGIASFFGYMAMMLVSISRDAYTVNGELVWRNVFLVPVFVAAVLGVLLILFGRESRSFLNQKISYLSIPLETRIAEAEAKKEKAKSGGLGKAFKFIFTHKQPRNTFFASIFQLFAVMAFFGYYESIMSTSGMTTGDVTKALLLYPLTCAICSLGIGYISDKIGRKKTGVISAVLAFAGLIAFIICAKNGMNPYIVGLIMGVEIGSFWSYGDQLGLVFSETVPTEIRSSATAAKGLIAVVVSILAAVIIGVLINFIPLSTLCLIWGAVTIGISALLFVFTVKETNGADLENVVSD